MCYDKSAKPVAHLAPIQPHLMFHRFLTSILWFIAAILVLIVIAVPGIYVWLSLEKPKTDGEIMTGEVLEAPVRVVRDEYGIPHIFAESMDDAYVALGYVHAQDRLFQMEMQRRAGQGRLSELLGRLTLQVDRMMRTFDFYRNAKADYEQGSTAAKRAAQRYADGVNLYLTTSDDPPPVEFRLLGLMQGSIRPHEPEPWQPADSVVWGKLMGLQLSGNMYDEIMRALLATELSAEEIANLTLFDQSNGSITLSAVDYLKSTAIDWAGLDAAIPRLGPNRASNVWAIDGRHTASGKPILANDPHLGLAAPILWYLARIETPELTITGATAPGVPFHILGHNDEAAWGFTTTGGDVMDLFIEQGNPDDPDRYLTETGDEAFEYRVEEISIGKHGDSVPFIVRQTRHGPVISDLDDRLGALTEDGKFVSLRTTLTEPDDTSWEAIYHLNRARNWDDFIKAMSGFKSGQQNAVFANTAGDIGLFAPARIPIRAVGDGTVPLDGRMTAPNWKGWIPVDSLPRVHNPDDGMIVNANNRLTPPDYPYHITNDWEPDYRARRIEEWLHNNAIAKPADHAALMTDTQSMAARDMLKILNSIEGETAMQRQVLQRLKSWDGRMDRDRPEPLIFATWLREMTIVLLSDELGRQAALLPSSDPRLIERIISNDQHWCDDINTQPFSESCEQAVLNGLSRALGILIERYGYNWQAWRWGTAHKAPLAHQLLGRLPMIGGLFRQDVEMDGGNYTVLRAAGRAGDAGEYPVTHGAGYRAVYDLANLDDSLMMIATGQSGRPFSSRFDSFVAQWQAGQFIQIPRFTAEAADDVSGAAILTFSPQASPQSNSQQQATQ